MNYDFLSGIQLVASDCDGVLTDGGLYYTEHGDIMKRFNVLDGMGFIRLREIGIFTAIITAEKTPIAEQRANKLNVDFFVQGTKDKLSALQDICGKLNVDICKTCYIGDDMFDLPAIKAAGFGCAPPNALKDVKLGANYVTQTYGGHGCFREVAEMIIAAKSI